MGADARAFLQVEELDDLCVDVPRVLRRHDVPLVAEVPPAPRKPLADRQPENPDTLAHVLDRHDGVHARVHVVRTAERPHAEPPEVHPQLEVGPELLVDVVLGEKVVCQPLPQRALATKGRNSPD